MTEPKRAVTEEPVNPSTQSSGPLPRAFESSVRPCLSNTKISDPRSIALPIAVTGSYTSGPYRNDTSDSQFVGLFQWAMALARACFDSPATQRATLCVRILDQRQDKDVRDTGYSRAGGRWTVGLSRRRAPEAARLQAAKPG